MVFCSLDSSLLPFFYSLTWAHFPSKWYKLHEEIGSSVLQLSGSSSLMGICYLWRYLCALPRLLLFCSVRLLRLFLLLAFVILISANVAGKGLAHVFRQALDRDRRATQHGTLFTIVNLSTTHSKKRHKKHTLNSNIHNTPARCKHEYIFMDTWDNRAENRKWLGYRADSLRVHLHRACTLHDCAVSLPFEPLQRYATRLFSSGNWLCGTRNSNDLFR